MCLVSYTTLFLWALMLVKQFPHEQYRSPTGSRGCPFLNPIDYVCWHRSQLFANQGRFALIHPRIPPQKHFFSLGFANLHSVFLQNLSLNVMILLFLGVKVGLLHTIGIIENERSNTRMSSYNLFFKFCPCYH